MTRTSKKHSAYTIGGVGTEEQLEKTPPVENPPLRTARFRVGQKARETPPPRLLSASPGKISEIQGSMTRFSARRRRKFFWTPFFTRVFQRAAGEKIFWPIFTPLFMVFSTPQAKKNLGVFFRPGWRPEKFWIFGCPKS